MVAYLCKMVHALISGIEITQNWHEIFVLVCKEWRQGSGIQDKPSFFGGWGLGFRMWDLMLRVQGLLVAAYQQETSSLKKILPGLEYRALNAPFLRSHSHRGPKG